MSRREEFEAALAEAEAVLAEIAVNSSIADAGRAETNESLEKARAYCRQARAALVKFDRSAPTGMSGPRIDTLIRHLGEVSEQATNANLPLIRPGMRVVGGKRIRSKHKSGQPKPFHRLVNAPAGSPLVRQTIGLLALTIAYLQYFYFDVQLQIISLPSAITYFTAQVIGIS